jgi:hypothetical protein
LGFEADETGETFDRTFKTIATHKPKGEDMRLGWAVLVAAIPLCACASPSETPPPNALVKDAATAIEIGMKGCEAQRKSDKAENVTNWRARYGGGSWEIRGGDQWSPNVFPDCFYFQITVDAETGKVSDCTECVVVT